jgi:hypothetical protein
MNIPEDGTHATMADSPVGGRPLETRLLLETRPVTVNHINEWASNLNVFTTPMQLRPASRPYHLSWYRPLPRQFPAAGDLPHGHPDISGASLRSAKYTVAHYIVFRNPLEGIKCSISRS